MKRSLIALAGLVLLTAPGAARARVEADPGQDYPVTPAQGPWMICVSSFSGSMAGELAHKLVLELRQDYNLPAFVFNRGAQERKELAELQRRRREQQESFLQERGLSLDPDQKFHTKTYRVEDQFAVLVGGYPDADVAHAALQQIRKQAPPRSVPRDTVFHGTGDETGNSKGKLESAYVHPFLTAFVTRNPTVTQAQVRGPDPLLKKWNEGESFSLLECPQPWTLVVKVYSAPTVWKSKTEDSGSLTKIWDKLFGKDQGNQLVACAVNAHNLAEGLRKLKFDAYVLHTRTNSIVTVGGFASQDDPRIETVKQTLSQCQFGVQGAAGVPAGLESAVQLMARPIPMQVPRP